MITANTYIRYNRLQSSGGTSSKSLKCCITCHPLTKSPYKSSALPLVCNKRSVLLGGASLLLAPLLSQQASAIPNLVGSVDSTAPSFNGFDGVGGTDADYANAEVCHTHSVHLTVLRVICTCSLQLPDVVAIFTSTTQQRDLSSRSFWLFDTRQRRINASTCDLQLREIAVGNGGGVASVHVDGFEQLMPIFIGVAEAAALVYATTGGEGSRPSTLGTWRRSLEVCHVYSSILLSFCSQPTGGCTRTSGSDVFRSSSSRLCIPLAVLYDVLSKV